MAYPIYRDADHLYTLCRIDRGYAIIMIPVSEGINGVAHIIATAHMDTQLAAVTHLKDFARYAGLKKAPRKRCNARRGREPDHHNDITTGRIAQ